MRKTLLLFLVALSFVHYNAFSQTAIIQDDFESYTAGQLLATNSTLWKTWSGDVAGEDAYVSNTYSVSGSNSINVIGYNGPTDLILPFPQDYTAGVYEFSLKMLITSGHGGYFNIQESATPGVGWMFEIYFDDAGGGFINAGGSNTATVTYTPDEWMSINVWVDLNADVGELFLNTKSIHTWQWSLGANGTENSKKMGGVDIFSYSADGSDSDMYIDNVMLSEITTTGIFVDDFERFVPGQLVAGTSDIWKTWSGDVPSEDATVSGDYYNSGFNAVLIEGNNGPTDLILPFAQDYTTGVYDFSLKMYLVGGFGGYFNIQQSATPGVGWMFEIYFDNAGGGYINAGGASAATFSYSSGAWNDILLKIDLTNDQGDLWINGNLIHTWQWSLASGGTGTVNAFGGVNFYAAAANSQDAQFLIDDVVLAEGFPTAINNLSLGGEIFVAPNPSNGQFSVAINDLSSGTYQLELIDLMGRVISSETMSLSGSLNKNFNLDVPNGVYTLRLSDGKLAATRKIVVN